MAGSTCLCCRQDGPNKQVHVFGVLLGFILKAFIRQRFILAFSLVTPVGQFQQLAFYAVYAFQPLECLSWFAVGPSLSNEFRVL